MTVDSNTSPSMTAPLIALEGLDGSGKTTVRNRLQSRYSTDEVVFTREPTETWYGDAVNQSLADPDADSLAELFLYAADHAAHLQETIEPALAADRAVITDRYVDSRYAYQSIALAQQFGSVRDALAFVRKIHTPWTRHPSCTIFIDVAPETGVERSGATNKFEQREYLHRVQTVYERLAEQTNRFERVDGEQPVDAVVDAVTEITDPLIRD